MCHFKRCSAQVVMSDFLMGMIILMAILAGTTLVWNRNVESLRVKNTRSEMEALAISITDQLVREKGVPDDWNGANVISIGLAKEDNVLDSGKVAAFTGLTVGITKELLGIENYNFVFRVRSTDETVLAEHGSPPDDAEETVIVRRIVIYGNQPAFMDFGLWI